MKSIISERWLGIILQRFYGITIIDLYPAFLIILIFILLYVVNLYFQSALVSRYNTVANCISVMVIYLFYYLVPTVAHSIRQDYEAGNNTITDRMFEDLATVGAFVLIFISGLIFIFCFHWLIGIFIKSPRILPKIKFNRVTFVLLGSFPFYLIISGVNLLGREPKKTSVTDTVWATRYSQAICSRLYNVADSMFNDDKNKKLFANGIPKRLKSIAPVGVEYIPPDRINKVYQDASQEDE